MRRFSSTGSTRRARGRRGLMGLKMIGKMEKIDFGIGWPVKEKNDLFLDALRAECEARKLKFTVVYERSLGRFTELVKKRKVQFVFFLDMASETHSPQDKFTQFVYCLKDAGTVVVADPDQVKFSSDKSITHFNLVKRKIPVPYTVVIRNWESTRRLTEEQRHSLGLPFVVKPALGYGQKGVKIIRNRHSLKEIAEARQFSPGDNFLIQEFIEPLYLDGRPAWFRVFYLFGEVFPCWWNPFNNEFYQVTLQEFDAHKLVSLVRIVSEIAEVTGVEWFSCEITLAAKTKKFVVIDYMNDQCAMYPKSQHKDGVPDELIVLIARRMAVRAWEFVMDTFLLPQRAVWFPRVKRKGESM